MSETDLLTDEESQLVSVIVYVFMCGVISLFGTITNVINMVIFYKQGLNATINISFFAMAISDLCCQTFQQVFNIFVNPLFQDTNLPLVYNEVQYLSTAVVRETFAKITCLITVYITAERCLCIAFPLHVKQMITPKRTMIVIIIIYSITLSSGTPLFFTSHIGWKFIPERNKTLLGLVFGPTGHVAEALVYIIHGITGLAAFMAVIVLTLILIYKLREKNEWQRKSMVTKGKADAMSNRDRTTIFMVVLIASILIVCYTPAVLLFLATFCEPEFNFRGRYYNLYYSCWSFALLFEDINSSVNVFLYYKMSSKYRQTFKEVFVLGCQGTQQV